MIEDYHGERKIALNENDSQAMPSSRFTVNKKKYTKESHLYSMFQHNSLEILPLIFMGVEMFLFDNNVLKIHLLNTQLNCHIMYFNYFILFICFIKQFVGSI